MSVKQTTTDDQVHFYFVGLVFASRNWQSALKEREPFMYQMEEVSELPFLEACVKRGWFTKVDKTYQLTHAGAQHARLALNFSERDRDAFAVEVRNGTWAAIR